MKRVQVMGPGCAKCDEAEQRAQEAVAELKIDAIVEKVTDFQEMATHGVFSTPAVVIDGKVMVVGRVPKKKELVAWLSGA